jgi:catechol 2,3-dioxygenase-like lactoylglutathione lyase family enzyme
MKALLEVVILPVSDPDVSLHFYRDLVGFDLDVDFAPAVTAQSRIALSAAGFGGRKVDKKDRT